jgi:ATP-dependent RNA helicase DDX10/DBP4
MAPNKSSFKKRTTKTVPQSSRLLKRKRDEEDLINLEKKVHDLDLATPITTFAELPLSKATASGLEASHFKTLTTIQQKAITLALKGHDVLGAAKTGSGKTLAFLVPVLEKLVRKKWTEFDGLGALIMSPTRELAIQIFEVLRKIGRNHTFSAGLVIGGKNLHEEQERLGRMNILVCTPGRMLQHLDQTATFEVDNLQILVLDEADRILDMGFQSTVDALVDHLPKERQTLLFSATQTKRVSDLARLSLKDPEYVSVHESASTATPENLQQHYVMTPLPEKLDTLWSFLRSNTKSKILVFLSSAKQVRFIYESFRHLQPGIPLLHLHGRQKQTARLDITSRFTSAKHSCLFSTDVAARGLDFPAVDWVIQLDCPEDADTYIHRVGRTARYQREGRAVIFIDPSEEVMLKRLEQKKVPIEEIKVKQNKQQSIKSQLQNMCFKDPELKYLGQTAFVSYVKSIHVQKDKEVFDLQKLPLEEFAASLGLPGAPRIKFQKGDDAKERKNAPRQRFTTSEDEDGGQEKAKGVRTKYDRMFERQNQDILSSRYKNLIDEGQNAQESEEDDDFLEPKQRLASISLSPEPEANQTHKVISLGGEQPLVIDSKRREKLLKSKKQMLKFKGKGTKLVYDDDGNAHEVYELEDEEDFKKRGTAADQRQRFVEEEKEKVKLADIKDKALVKEKRQAKKEKRRVREREEREAQEGAQAILAPYEDDELNDYAEVEDQVQDDTQPRDSKRRKIRFDESDGTEEDVDFRNSKTKSRRQLADIEPETLEDLEALAASYL